MKIRSILFSLSLVLFLLQGSAFAQWSEASVEIKAAPPVASIFTPVSNVCLGDSVSANISFSGTGPWDAVINDNNGVYTVLTDVTSPTTIYLKPTEDNTYYIASVTDSSGVSGTTSGSVTLTVNSSTPVTIELDKQAYLFSDPGVALQSDPAGGVFKGEGVSSNAFYPGIAGPVNSPYTLTCTYTNGFGCKSSDDVVVHVLYGNPDVYLISEDDTINAVCDEAGAYLIRGSNKNNIPGRFTLVTAGSNEPVSGPITDTDTLDGLASLDPLGLSGAYDIIYKYQFQGLVDSATYRFVINDLGVIKIDNLPDVVCKNDAPYLLVPELALNDPGAIYSFSGPAVSGNQEDGFYFDPGADDAPLGKMEISMNYTSSNGCSASSMQVVTNSFIPDVKFSVSGVCIPAEGGGVSFRNLTTGKYSVDTWSWDFGDPASGTDNTSSDEHAEHLFADAGAYQIGLTAKTREGCVVTHRIDTVFIDEPIADFTWLSDCFSRGSDISFLDRSSSEFAELDTFIWTFKTTSGGVLGWEGTGSSTDTVKFQFPSLKNYNVELQIENDAGCTGEIVQEIVFYPTIAVPAGGYENDFNGDKTDWFVVSADQSPSWKIDIPDFNGFQSSPGDKAWYTDLPVHTAGYNEVSWIQSPCFDFSKVDKPLIQLDLMKSFDPGKDGVVVQYQELISDGWKTIGNVGEGTNWYNSSAISNKPGGSTFGWGLESFNPDTEWISASHDLAAVARHSGVKFRIIIGTGGAKEIGNQGFAFDNIFMGERINFSLLEYFTNSSSMECREADLVVDKFAEENTGSVIDLQFHMDFPGADEMNANNELVPFTRFFQKGIPGVPYAILNGGAEAEHRYDFSDASRQPGSEDLEQYSNQLPVFDLNLQVDWLENGLDASVRITCEADTFSSDLDLYVTAIETSVTAYTGENQDAEFRNVVLDMLTSPSGDWVGNEWFNGKTESRTFSWEYSDYIEDIEELAVVAFVQDRVSGEVVQVVASYLTPQVGMEFRKSKPEMLITYPNPADNYLYINLGGMNSETGRIALIDLSGKEVISQDIKSGFSLYRMDVSHLEEGIYMICLKESGLIKGRKKVLIVR